MSKCYGHAYFLIQCFDLSIFAYEYSLSVTCSRLVVFYGYSVPPPIKLTTMI